MLLNLQKIENDGWCEASISGSLLEEKYNLINSKLKIYHKIYSLEKIKLVKNNCNKQEINKSLLRALLRYNECSHIFLKKLAIEIAENDKIYKDYYLNLPYLIFHLPFDNLEAGYFHNDELTPSQKEITIWISLNNFQTRYSPISIIKKTHSFIFNKIFRILSKFGYLENYIRIFLNKKLINIIPKEDSIYLWNALTYHKGNLNTTKCNNFAITMKLSKVPHPYEISYKLSELFKNQEKNLEYNNDLININEIYKSKIEMINFSLINNLNFEEDFIKYKNFFSKFKLNHLEKKILSFSLSLFAQRETNEKLKNSIDFFSVLLGSVNKVAEHRLSKIYKKKLLFKFIN